LTFYGKNSKKETYIQTDRLFQTWFTAPKASTGPQAERGDLSVVFDTTLHFSSV